MLCFGIVFGWVGDWMLIVVLIVLFMGRSYSSLVFWVLAAMFVLVVITLVCGLVLLVVCADLFWGCYSGLILSCYCAICGCLLLGFGCCVIDLLGFGYCGVG